MPYEDRQYFWHCYSLKRAIDTLAKIEAAMSSTATRISTQNTQIEKQQPIEEPWEEKYMNMLDEQIALRAANFTFDPTQQIDENEDEFSEDYSDTGSMSSYSFGDSSSEDP